MSKETVLTGLNARAPGYVPEWRPSSPDAGTALAHIWAELFSGTLERFERLPGNCRRALLDMMGSEAKPALPARGVLAFQAGGERVRVPAGTGTASPGNPDAVLETERDLDVSPALIDAVFYASPSRGAVTRYPGRENIALFGAEAPEPHIWTFRHPYAFRVSERSSLRLRVEPESAGALLCDHTAVWEAGGEDGWEVFSARPGGRGILLNLPPGQGAERQTLRVTLPGGAASNAAIRSVTALPGGNALFPDAVYAGDMQLSGGRVYPFDKRFIPGLCFYVACGDAFDKPGADIELSFHLSFEDFPIEGYPEVQIRLKKLMKAAELEPPPDYVIDIAEIAWEYYNGTGWALLNAGEPEMFSDSPAKRCTVRFTCPGDMSPTVWGAHEAPFIRARVLAVNNLFRMTGHYRAPVITGLRLRYAGQFPLCSAEVFEHRERRTVTFPAALRGALPEPEAVYFAWSEAFCEGTVFFDIDGRRPSPLRWEYAVPGGWERLGVHDGTDGLTKSGILAYRTSGPCAKTRLFGHEGYWMRVCPEGGAFEGGLRPVARLLGIAENAVPASARFPGTEANLPPGAFRSLLTPLAGISAVSNPTRCAGGAAEEEERHVIRRLTAGLCHNGRAVSAADCEALALEASPLVLRARYFCNAGEDGTFEPGRDCLAVSCEGDFEAVRRDVLSYVGARRPLGAGKLSVVPLTGVLDAQAV